MKFGFRFKGNQFSLLICLFSQKDFFILLLFILVWNICNEIYHLAIFNYIGQWHCMFTLLHNYHHPSPRFFFLSSQTETMYLLNSNFPFLTPPPFPINYILLSMNLSNAGLTYKWNHKIFPLLFLSWLTSLSIMFSKFINIVACIRI